MVLTKGIFHLFDYEERSFLYDANSMAVYEITQVENDLIHGIQSISSLETEYSQQAVLQSYNKLKTLDELSYLSAQYETHISKERERKISTLWLNVSHVCNLNCDYCFVDWDNCKNQGLLMSQNTIGQAVDFLINQLEEGSKGRIVFFGGEPIMNFDAIKECVYQVKKKATKKDVSINFHLITNGTLLNKKIINFLRENSISIQISIDGPPDMHNELRKFHNGRGSYKRIHENLLLLHKEGLDEITARATVTHKNCHVGTIYTFLRGIGFKNIHMEPVQADTNSNYAITEEDILKIKQEYRCLALDLSQSIRQGTEADLGFFSNYISRIIRGEKKLFFCGAGYHSLTVTPQGTLFPCHRLVSDDRLSSGHVESGVILSEATKTLGKLSVDERSSCQKCWAKYLCGGGCAAVSLFKNGSYNMPDETLCTITKAVIENALLLYVCLNDPLVY